MDQYPVLITWNGIQQRHNSWQDGVSGTNCAIQPGTNWTYEFQLKDQIGSFFYFPSLYFEKAGGGFGPIRVNNRVVVQPPFPEPEGDFHLLIGDWYEDSFEFIGDKLAHEGYNNTPNIMLMNGKVSYLDPNAKSNESFTVQRGKTYRLRISNVGSEWSFNFRIQNHSMLLVETEGSYTNQITLDSLDVHVGQSYSVLVTADQDSADYYIVATAKMANSTQLKTLEVVSVLHYENSTKPADGPLPNGPDPFDVNFSISQARSIRWNLTTGAARPNPQGSFNVSNVTLSQTFVLQNSVNKKNGMINYAINNVSYATPQTPLKLADYYLNGGAGVYELDKFPANSSLPETVYGTFVISGEHKGWLEIVFKNEFKVMDSWHLDGFGFFVVGYGSGNWTPKSRRTYNLYDPVVRSTVQVYPKGWTAVYVYLDNPGMWNLRSQNLKHWYLGQELYIRVYDSDPNPAKEHLPPKNLLYCGSVQTPPSAPPPSPKPVPAPPAPASPSSAATITTIKRQWFNIIEAIFVLLIIWDGSWCL
nr:monocopper oxidase-like protein SKU5 [Nicotiana tomentosiformis]